MEKFNIFKKKNIENIDYKRFMTLKLMKDINNNK